MNSTFRLNFVFISMLSIMGFCGSISAQITVTPGMVQQAKSMGASDAQINAVLNATEGGASQSTSATSTVQSSNTTEESSQRDASTDEGETQDEEKIDKRRTPSTISKSVFGQEIFSTENLTFAPSYNIATPPNYVLGPGDEVVIEVWGESEFRVQEKISPEGSITIQGIGPVFLSGLTVAEAQQRSADQISEIMNGQVRVTLGQIRSIKVNISGEVRVPGTYTLPALATLFNALYTAGGVNNIGSLRHVKVYRDSKEVADLDVYDYLINGKYETNIRLEDNDMIIVPPYDNHVQIEGKVKRERAYDLKDGETLSALIDSSGGFTGDAYSENVTVYRKSGGRALEILTIDRPDFAKFEMQDGDLVRVGEVLPVYLNLVAISGAVWRPGQYELSDKVSTLSQLIAKAEGLKGTEFASRGQISRIDSTGIYTVIPFDVREVMNGQDIPLCNLDEVYIPNVYDLHEDYTVTVSGEVNAPNTIAYRKGMTVEDVILLCGGLRESASMAKVEIARRVKDPQSTTYTPKTAEVYTFDITEDLKIAPEDARFIIQPFDEIIVRRSPGYSAQQKVYVTGQVLFEGGYVLATAGSRLSDVIRSAGGFTPEAYVVGASVQRRMTEDQKARVQAVLDIANSNKGKDSIATESVVIPEYYPVGVDVAKAVQDPGCADDIILREGDRIFVPKYIGTVSISGAVLYQNTVVYDQKKFKEYIRQAGGYKKEARRRPFVVYMNGKVAATRGALFFKRYPKVEAGCQIIVPMKPERTGNGLASAMGFMSSSASLAAMVASIINLSK